MSVGITFHPRPKYSAEARIVNTPSGFGAYRPYIEFRIENGEGSYISLFIEDPKEALQMASILTEMAQRIIGTTPDSKHLV